LGQKLRELWTVVKANPKEYKDKNIVEIFEEMKNKAIEKTLHKLAEDLCLDYDSVKYSSEQYIEAHDDQIPYFTQVKNHSNPKAYSEKIGEKILKLDYYDLVKERMKKTFKEEVWPYRIDD